MYNDYDVASDFYRGLFLSATVFDTIQILHIEFYIMMRILLLIVLICLIYWIVTRLIASFKSDQTSDSNQANKNQGSETQTGQNQQSNTNQSDLKIVQCSRCGLHVPETESHLNNDQVICNNSQCNES